MDKLLKIITLILKISFALIVFGFAIDYVLPIFFYFPYSSETTAYVLGIFLYTLAIYLLFLAGIHIHRLVTQRKLSKEG